MHNVLVVGCGRSGTSMAAGTLAGAGYFMGERLHPPRESNPKGFFESGEINQINEALLTPLVPDRPGDPGSLQRGQRWLAQLPLDVTIPLPSAEIRSRMQTAIANQPFCFKDPRFCYAIPAWREMLEDTVFLCVFRHPAQAALSIVRECERMPNLHNLMMDFGRAVAIWSCMYRHVLRRHRHAGRWLFVDYRQFFEPGVVERIGEFVGTAVDAGFPAPALERTPLSESPGASALELYDQLLELARNDK